MFLDDFFPNPNVALNIIAAATNQIQYLVDEGLRSFLLPAKLAGFAA